MILGYTISEWSSIISKNAFALAQFTRLLHACINVNPKIL